MVNRAEKIVFPGWRLRAQPKSVGATHLPATILPAVIFLSCCWLQGVEASRVQDCSDGGGGRGIEAASVEKKSLAGSTAGVGNVDSSLANGCTTQKSTDKGPDSRQTYTVKKKGGIEFASGADYRLTLDVYYPETVGRYPAVVMLHGGAWAWGSKLHWRRHALRLARQGFVVVTPNYRLAPKHKFPAQIDDVRVAVKWLKRHADDYHIDVTKVGAYGYSAGGHLALLLGTAPESDRFRAWAPRELKGVDSRVSVVVAGGSPADFQWLTPNSRSLVYWLGATPRERPDVYREASPLENLDRNDRVACLLYHAENDALVPPESSRRFYEKLQTLGHPSSFVMLEGMGHFWGFLNTDIVDSAAEFYRGEFER